VFVDDDLLSREGASGILNNDGRIRKPLIHLTLEEAINADLDYWRRFDVIVVDTHDERRAVQEQGTDVYTGVELIESLRLHGITATIVAIVTTRHNPLLWERLTRAGASYVYERVEFQNPADLVRALISPDERYKPVSFPRWVLSGHGLGLGANPNRAVACYKASPLYGEVAPNRTLSATGSRRQVNRLKMEIVATGFVGTGPDPRWNEVRDYLLKLTGRLPVDVHQHPGFTPPAPTGPSV
jgi:DNA-binding NarL/FixJ family response regulator